MSEIACNIIGVKKYRPSVQCSYGFNGVDLTYTLVRRHSLHNDFKCTSMFPLHLSYTYVKSLSIVSWFNL